MGRGLRRVTEAVRQMFGSVPDDHFQATSNARNEAMFKEAADFSLHLRTMEKDLRAMERQMTGQFQNLRDILITLLPRVYDWADGGSAAGGEGGDRAVVAARGNHEFIGNAVDYDALEKALTHMKERLEDEVYKPMHEWTKEFKRVQAEMKVLEALRLELDSRKRTVVTLDKKLTFQRNKSLRLEQPAMGSSAGGGPLHVLSTARGLTGSAPKLEEDIEKIKKKKEEKEEKRGVNQDNFDRQEHDTFQRLETLILDAASLREYAATSLFHIRECFASALLALDAPAAMGLLPSPAADAQSPAGLLRQSGAAIGDKVASRGGARPATQSAAGYASSGGGRDSVAGAYDQQPPAVNHHNSNKGFDAAGPMKIAPPSAADDAAAQPRYAPPAYAAVPYGRYIN